MASISGWYSSWCTVKSGPTFDAPPRELVEAFKVIADARIESLASFVVEDGFDAETMRVLSAWTVADVPWSRPPKPCPDGGRPTQRAWLWLMSGIEVDIHAIADATGLSRSLVLQKVRILIAARLVFPDGEISKPARAALQQAVAERISGTAKKKTPASTSGKAN